MTLALRSDAEGLGELQSGTSLDIDIRDDIQGKGGLLDCLTDVDLSGCSGC